MKKFKKSRLNIDKKLFNAVRCKVQRSFSIREKIVLKIN